MSVYQTRKRAPYFCQLDVADIGQPRKLCGQPIAEGEKRDLCPAHASRRPFWPLNDDGSICSPESKPGAFVVWNETDEVYASPDTFKTREEAESFAARFRNRFAAQGYYLTSDRQRIGVADVVLVVIPAEA